MPSSHPATIPHALLVALTFLAMIACPAHGQEPTGTVEGHPALHRAPRHTTTHRGHRGDPVNIAFVGTEEEIHRALAAARWYAADPITLKSSLRIAADVVLRKPYEHAPVSDLFLWGRRQDLAYEQPVGNSPKQRHHVRFWRSEEVDAAGEPLWLGAATFDEQVEMSREAGGVTHKIAPEVDRERNKLVGDTARSGVLDGYYWVDRFHPERQGTNGGGDPWVTDGRLAVGVLEVRR